MKELRGVLTAMATPFREDGAVDNDGATGVRRLRIDLDAHGDAPGLVVDYEMREQGVERNELLADKQYVQVRRKGMAQAIQCGRNS